MRQFPQIVALACALAAAVPAWAQNEASDKALISGAWRMISLEAGPADGKLEKVSHSGQIVFTEAGTMSVQAVNPDTSAPPTPYVVNGYEAFYGQIQLDEQKRTFAVTVESSLVRNLIGQKLERAYEVSDKQLVLTPANPAESWRVVYERF